MALIVLSFNFTRCVEPMNASRRLIESNVAVGTDSQHLNINSACRSNGRIIIPAFRFHILSAAAWNMDILSRHVDVCKQMLPHKIVIALVVVLRQSAVLVQIECCDL